MPVYNERATVERALDELLATHVSRRRLGGRRRRRRVDRRDRGAATRPVLGPSRYASSGTTGTAAREPRCALRLPPREGTYATVMDADLEYSPADIPLLLDPLRNGDADAVFGTRGFQSHSAYSFWYVIGNRAVSFAANLIYNCWISDIMTGQKAMRTEVFRSLRPPRARLRNRGGDHRAARPARRPRLRGADRLQGAEPRARARS